jgi:V-type H+-transporting ATPase subunit d
MFDAIATLAVASNMRELFRLVLVDTPLASYFADHLTSEDLDEMNIEVLRNTLYKVLCSTTHASHVPVSTCGDSLS